MASLLLVTVGIAFVAFTVLLFGQCVQIKNGNLSSDTHVAQFVLYDVITQVADRSRNGIKPENLAGPLLTRVSVYLLFGLALIALGAWRPLHRMLRGTGNSHVPPNFPPGQSVTS